MHQIVFQYPLVDRVGFEGTAVGVGDGRELGFSILWWIELVLRDPTTSTRSVTVGAFQYPLVDRVGFEGRNSQSSSGTPACFSILWWIELVLRGRPDRRQHTGLGWFQYPLESVAEFDE